MSPETKQRIVEVAARLFSKKGVKTVSIQQLSGELGVSTKTIYLYFKTKEEIVKEVLLLGINADRALIKQLMTQKIPSLEKVLIILDYFSLKTKASYPGIIDDLKKYYSEEYKLIDEFIAEVENKFYPKYIFKPGIREGYFRKSMNIKIITRFISVVSIIAWSQDYYSVEEFGNRNIYGELIKNILMGISTKKGSDYLEKRLKKYPNLKS